MSSSSPFFWDTFAVSTSVEPTQIVGGDTVKWRVTPADTVFGQPSYLPSDGWTLHYSLKNSSGSYKFDTTTEGDDFVVNEDSSIWPDGNYMLIGYVTNADESERHTTRTSKLKILPDPAGDEPIDFRSLARKVYDQIKSDMDRGVVLTEYTIGGRTFKYNTPDAQLAALRYWADRVAVEEGKAAAIFGVSFG